MLKRVEAAALAGGAAAVPGWAYGGRIYLLFFDTLEALDAMSSGSAADVGEQAALELLLEQAAEVDGRAERRAADVVAPQLQAQGEHRPLDVELALENAALGEMRRRISCSPRPSTGGSRPPHRVRASAARPREGVPCGHARPQGHVGTWGRRGPCAVGRGGRGASVRGISAAKVEAKVHLSSQATLSTLGVVFRTRTQ